MFIGMPLYIYIYVIHTHTQKHKNIEFNYEFIFFIEKIISNLTYQKKNRRE